MRINGRDEYAELSSAKRLGVKHTISRVRNPIYYRQMDLLKEDLHLSMAVNPELTAANEIARVLLFPETSKVETFMKGKVELVEYPVRENSPLVVSHFQSCTGNSRSKYWYVQ